MGVSWSSPRKRRGESDLPDHPFILAAAAIDPGSPAGMAVVFAPVVRAPYSRPDKVQDDVIEPTAVFKPWLGGGVWDQCIIETWVDEA